MANEPTTAITGNLTADPELRFTPTGRPVASFTIANTPRFPDKTTGQWQDGETWFVRCSAWGDMAENITTSLSKGNAVVATGRLRCRTWETPEGDKRSVVEMTVDDLGPSLRRAIVKVTKAIREHPAAGETPGAAAYDASGPAPAPATAADQWSTPAPAPVPGAGQAADEPPF
jgi:single-strand DNA-binding protein